ncbi:MAG: PRC-barrel domain-containing protein, partial [Gammaproteobacteria bacterium]|nr:PRC-barrel domain-containing protein [Gammaproteobacteria bacterium]
MKKTKLTRIALATALAAGLATSATATTAAGQSEPRTADKTTMSPTKADPGQAYRALTASNIIGKSVRGENGKNVGQVEDLVVNLNDGKVRYAILSFDPGIFESEDLYAIPIKEL